MILKKNERRNCRLSALLEFKTTSRITEVTDTKYGGVR